MDYPNINDPTREPYLPECDLESRLNSWTLIHKEVKSEQAIGESKTCIGCANEPCGHPLRITPSQGVVGGCPLGNNVRDWHQILKHVDLSTLRRLIEEVEKPFKETGFTYWKEHRDVKYRETVTYLHRAYELLIKTNPFPEFFVACPAFCHHACVARISSKGDKYLPIGIQATESFIISMAFKLGFVVPKIMPETGKKVAIVGSGPAGLALAQRLSECGHKVVVYEKDDKPGGLMRYGIPEYHLPEILLDRRIKLMEEEGIEFFCNTIVGNDITIRQLLDDFDHLAIAIGSSIPREHPQFVQGNPGGVYHAMDFLKDPGRFIRVWRETPPRNILAVGAGYSVLDIVGTLRRMFNTEGISSPETFDVLVRRDMPELNYNPYHEPENYLEGIMKCDELMGRPLWETQIESFILDEDEWIETVTLADKESNGGKPRQVDLLFLALGFTGPDVSSFTEADLKHLVIKDSSTLGPFKMDDKGFSPVNSDISVVGDCAIGASTIVQAAAEGTRAAYYINQKLGGPADTIEKPVV